MISERKSFLIAIARRLDSIDEDLGFIEDACATIDLPYEFGEDRGRLRELRADVERLIEAER